MQTVTRYGLCFLLSTATVLSCKNSTTTAGLLDASFVTTFKLYMSVPGDVIYDGKDFDMRLEAKPSATSMPLKGISGGITWTLTGGGTLAFVSCPDMKEGVQTCKMRYSAGLTAGQTKLIKLQAVHDSTKESSADTFTVATQTFSVSVPSRISVNTTFTATITATDPTGITNTNYTGTVLPYLALMPGRPSIDEISNFVNGVATVQMKIHKPAWQMQLVVYDKANSAFAGTSNTFRAVQNDGNYVGLDLVAVPRTATENRLSWTYLDSTVVSAYKIYRKDTNGTYQLVHTENTTTASYYRDLGLTTGQNYQYKIEAVNSGGDVISTDFASSTPKGCTTVTSSPTAYTVWTKAQSPYCGSIQINLTAALVIEPGVVVMWNGGSAWAVNSQLLKAVGTPNEPIIFTSSSATPATGHFPGFTVTSATPSVVDGSGNYISGSLFKYVHFEYGIGAYWQSQIYYYSWIFRYMSGLLVFENLPSTLDGGVYARNSICIQPKGSPAPQVNNMIFFGNASALGGAYHLKTDGTGVYNLKITGNYFALNTGLTNASWPASGAITVNPNYSTIGTTPGVTSGTFQISDNQFFNNSNQTAGYKGGAILLDFNGAPTVQIYNNTFFNNLAGQGGAIAIDNTVSGGTINLNNVTISSNYFANNSASTNGGAVAIFKAAAAFTMTGNSFSANTGIGANFYNAIAQNHNVQNSYWGTNTPDTTCGGRAALGIMDSCNGGSGTLNAAGAVTTAYPLCITDPSVAGCVGAR